MHLYTFIYLLIPVEKERLENMKIRDFIKIMWTVQMLFEKSKEGGKLDLNLL